ncbi:MAG: hypothetical protein KTQ49_03745 [Candidatus Omnitrophica bacterium]|nr:hypothetical protein [Candidatus Omnitrophota bacterium]
MIKKILLGVFVLFLCSQVAAFAAVMVGERTGSLKITQADGTVVTVGPADAMPEIMDGATIEVLSGTVTLLTPNGGTATMDSGSRILVSPTSENGFEVMSGRVQLTDADGNTVILTPSGVLPDVPDMDMLEGNVQTEETARDISPVS